MWGVISKKAKSRAGFTLAETLLAVLILLLVSTIVATGVPAAKNAYEKVVLGSNAQVLLSTTVNTLREELGTAKDVKIDNGEIIYTNSLNGSVSKITKKSNAIILQEYSDRDTFEFFDVDPLSIPDVPERPLISDVSATRQLYVLYDDVSWGGPEVVSFNNLKVYRKPGSGENNPASDQVIASLTALSIRVLSDNG